MESQTLKGNSTQKTLEGTRVSQRSSRDHGLPVEAISNAKIRASPRKHVQPATANAASHAELGAPSDGSGELNRDLPHEHADYNETQAEPHL